MNHPPPPESPLPQADSSNTLLVEMEDNGDVTRRPVKPEHIAAVKRYWQRQGRTPPPPWDKL